MRLLFSNDVIAERPVNVLPDARSWTLENRVKSVKLVAGSFATKLIEKHDHMLFFASAGARKIR